MSICNDFLIFYLKEEINIEILNKKFLKYNKEKDYFTYYIDNAQDTKNIIYFSKTVLMCEAIPYISSCYVEKSMELETHYAIRYKILEQHFKQIFDIAHRLYNSDVMLFLFQNIDYPLIFKFFGNVND